MIAKNTVKRNLLFALLIAAQLLMFSNLALAAKNAQKIDRDSITKEATLIKNWKGGSLYRIGGIDLVVLNGTCKEMGQQYGYFVKDKIIATREGWKKIFLDTGALTYESILQVIGRPFFESAPKTLKDLYKGIAETSGLTREEAVIMDNWLSLVLLGRRAGCSSFVAWGSETTDGTAYMGRNLDFPEFTRDLFAANGVITVMNPVGGDFGLAGMGIAGTISGFDDMMNSEGLYAGFNNGAGSIEPVMYSNRFPLPSFISETLHKYSTIYQLRIVFNTSKSNYPALMGVSQPDQGVHFELSPETYIAEATGNHSVRANQFINPKWGIPPLPGKTGWFSLTRMDAWGKALKAIGAKKINEKTIMKAMNAPMYNPDGSLTGTGFTVFELAENTPTGGGAESGDVTMYQLITHSAKRVWWLRVPTHTGWLKIDLKKYFK